ncbi:ead/Ea22-like family protein [Klebsiella pneumoniae]|nr:hypothetical protein APU00_12940 [Klebsiella pneumoniae]HBR1456554.1 ead/Ea22-like family protein [Klebsiella quasipneumoniae subsp. similipneumoniae]MBQ5046329.1 ead/Ea22-like family protein [Klebsiella pneumoniae]MBQ5073788.1 ead/Ea22-like family protein [Klebsiella pneumoniae]QOU37839.1 ead/Ea22-like family protein [Klebsiella pneumoniae]
MTDITELAQSLKAAAENAIGAHERLAAYPYGEIIDISQHEGEQIDIDITDLNEFNKEANPVNVLALVEALEKAQQERDNWRTSFDNERFRADKLKAHIDEMTEERTASINELSRIIQKEVKAKREAEKRIAELEAQNTVACLPGGFSIEESRSLQADLVRSHISKALSGEKMKSADKNADLQWIHSVIVRAAWFVKASVEATAGIKVEAE